MNHFVKFRAIICLTAATFTAHAQAKTFLTASGIGGQSNVVVEAARPIAGGRSVQIMVAQSEIKSDINPSNIAVAMGGGLLGGLLAASQNAARAKKAEAAIEPVRIALTGFDVDSLAQDTANATIAALPWLQPTSVTFGKDSSVLGKSALLDKAGADQIAFLEYAYDFSPDFSAVRVVETIQLANRALPAASTPLKPEARLSPKYAPYAQSVTSVVQLSTPSKEMTDNAARWSADNGKLARAALVSAFSKIQQLTPRILNLGAEDVKLLDAKENKRIMAGGYSGRPQSSNDGGTLLWTGGFVHVQTLQ